VGRSGGSSGRDVRQRAARLPRDPALVILVVTGCVHLLRGAPVDAAIFLAVALGLAVAELRPEPADAPMPARRPPGRVGPVEAVAVAAGSALFGVVVGSWTRYTAPVMWVVVVVGVLAVAAVWHQPSAPAMAEVPEPPPLGWGALAWVALALTWCGWELVSFVHEVNVADVSIGHPTLSDIVEPVLDQPVARWVVLALWLAAGYGLVRTGRRMVAL
jgi:hypothetical protein